jgi:capsular exopolysaccharide synthesis family protein
MIDGDLRRPQVARMFGIEPTVGLTSVLVGSVGFDDALRESSVEQLTLFSSGAIPPNPSELLQSHSMTDVIERARKDYDVIVIDAPPVLPVTDAAILASQADGVLMVVRHSETTREELHHSMERLGAVDAKVLGLVFTMVPARGPGRSDYGYGYAPEYPRSTTGSQV